MDRLVFGKYMNRSGPRMIETCGKPDSNEGVGTNGSRLPQVRPASVCREFAKDALLHVRQPVWLAI